MHHGKSKLQRGKRRKNENAMCSFGEAEPNNYPHMTALEHRLASGSLLFIKNKKKKPTQEKKATKQQPNTLPLEKPPNKTKHNTFYKRVVPKRKVEN